MRKGLIVFILCLLLPVQVYAMDYTAPTVPDSAQELMPDEQESFTEGLFSILSKALELVQPAMVKGLQLCMKLIAITLLISIVSNFPGVYTNVINLAGAIAIATVVFGSSNTMIRLGTDTVREISDYGKLLLPVMTAAAASHGATTTSASVYTVTAMFDALLGSLVSSVIVPLLYIFLCLVFADAAVGEGILEKLRDFVKWLMVWILKTVLYVFTGYIGITGVVSGATDAAALKAAKITISGVVPVVGGIMSDASEAILVSAGVMKNAVGVYGLLAIFATVAGPFIEIGVLYLMLKLTAAISASYATKQISGMIQNLSAAMGMLLAMTGAVCLMLMISTVCLMKGVN